MDSPKKKSRQLNPNNLRDEAEITLLLSGIVDLINAIGENFNSKIRMYLIEHLILSVRELGSYANKYFAEKIDEDIKSKMAIIKDIRDAICHRSSKNNWIQGYMKIQGSVLFKYDSDDVEIQYGNHLIYLKSGIIVLYQKYRDWFYSSDSVFKIKDDTYWHQISTTELITGIDKITKAIKQFEKSVLTDSL